MKRTPVIIQVDGKGFHNFTRGMKKPFDMGLVENMWNTAQYMCENIEGAKLAYTQSDEISILLTNYDTLNQGAFFDFRVQKLASIAASLATAGFNQTGRFKKVACFDGRCFNLDREEVNNFMVWRQQDCTRNSIQMVAQHYFSQKELNGKNQNELQEMLFAKHGINWNYLETYLKRGSCVIKGHDGNWKIDHDIPVFRSDRSYIEHFAFPERSVSV